MPLLNSLTEQHCQTLDCVLQQVPSVNDTIAALEECGIDCSAEKEKVQAIQQVASGLKKRFNPLAE